MKPSSDEADFIIGKWRENESRMIGTVKLKSEFGFYLELTVYVPSRRRSLISFSRLDKLG